MKYDTFTRLFDDVICTCAKDLVDSYASQKVLLEFDERCKKSIFENYIMLCSHMRSHYMGEKEDCSKEIRANRHKVAACFTVAIAMAHPLSFLESKNEEERKVHIANEYLGFMTGFGIVNSMLKEADENWQENEGFEFPQFYKDKKPFFDDLAVGLYNSVRALSIDLMSLSNVFALVEAYTIEKRHLPEQP